MRGWDLTNSAALRSPFEHKMKTTKDSKGSWNFLVNHGCFSHINSPPPICMYIILQLHEMINIKVNKAMFILTWKAGPGCP